MKKILIFLWIALVSPFAFMACTEDSELIGTGNTSISTAGDGDDDKDKYDFSTVYNGQTLYFKIDTTAVNECYVTSGNRNDWVTTDEETNDGYYTYYSGDVEIPSQVMYDGTVYKVTAIGEYAFYETKLTSVTIPSSMKNIGEEAFSYCDDLNEITVEGGNAEFTVVDDVLYTKDMTTLVVYPGGKTDTDFTVESFVDSIADYAFGYNTYLKNLTVESNTVELSYKILNSCAGLTSITVRDDNPNYTIVGGVLYNKDRTELLSYPQGKTATDFTVPSTVRKIKCYAFYNCSNLRTVTMQDGLSIIQEYAFWLCKNLRSVVIPSTTKQIITCAFLYCNNLSSITIYVLEPFDISDYVFDSWDEESYDTYQIYKNATLYVPAGTKTAYQNTDCWNYFEHIVEMSE